MRYFLTQVAKAARRGEIEVHAWCLLTTHFHMLVRSPQGQLSEAMRRIQNTYARYFNRSRRRDGPLHRGRFSSKPVRSLTYRKNLVHYIDNNPVDAGLVRDAREYRWCSANQYSRRRGPRWLTRNWLEGWVAELSGSDQYDPADYPRSAATGARRLTAAIVEARCDSRAMADDLDALVHQPAPSVLAWMQRKAKLADGTMAQQPLIPATLVSRAIGARAKRGNWKLRSGRQSFDAWRTMHVGLLRHLATVRFKAIAAQLEITCASARRIADRHDRLLATNTEYAQVAAAIGHELLGQVYRPEGRAARGGSEEDKFSPGSVLSSSGGEEEEGEVEGGVGWVAGCGA